MAPKKEKPPKKEKLSKKDKASKDDLTTVFNGMSMDGGDANGLSDGGRVATGLLVSESRARDIKISSFSLALHGRPLVEDTTIELNRGGRYGLVGRNGCGKHWIC